MKALLFVLATAIAAVASLKEPQKINFKTPDGWTLSANYFPPRSHGTVIILAHGVGSSKKEWNDLAFKLDEKGVGTLSLDLRGHQDSQQGPNGPLDFYGIDRQGLWPTAVNDLLAAANWLNSKGVKDSHIAFGGASIGANLAAIASQTRNNKTFLLLLSPGIDYRGVALQLPDKTNILSVAAPNDAYAYNTVLRINTSSSSQHTAPAGHGVQMLSDKVTMDFIVDWIVKNSTQPKAK